MVNSVFCVFRQENMTDGGGKMVLDSIWSNYQLACDFADIQPGVMGRTAKWSQEKWGDWEVKEVNVMGSADDIKMLMDEREKKLKELLKKYDIR